MSKKKKDTGATVSENESGQSVINIHDSDKFVEHLENVSEAMKEKIQPVQFVDGTVGDADVTILKATITKDDQLKVEHHYSKKDGNGGTWAGSCDAIVHNDLHSAFNELMPHLIILCDQKMSEDAEDILNEKAFSAESFQMLMDDYSVQGFSVGKNNDGITIIGRKDIEGKILNLTSPFEPFSESGYQFITQLRESLRKCKDEVVQYLNGKSGFKQADMFEENADDILGTTKEEPAQPESEEPTEKTW